MMMIDLSDGDISNDVDINPDATSIFEQVEIFPHLTPEKWVVVLPCKGSALDNDTVSNTRFGSKISVRFT